MQQNTMKVIIDKNTTIEKEKWLVKSLEQSIMEDKENGDEKSLKYHSMALIEHKKVLQKLELTDIKDKNDDFYLER